MKKKLITLILIFCTTISILAQNITILNGQTLTITSNTTISSLTVNDGGTLIVNSPYTLTIGTPSNSLTTQVVYFDINSTVNIQTGSFLVAYGLMKTELEKYNLVESDGESWHITYIITEIGKQLILNNILN